MKLYSFWRSSCSWRLRIALRVKGVPFEVLPVHLVRGGGEQHRATHRRRNPMAQVPVLEDHWMGEALILSQSVAIMEYLEERYPSPAILPDDLAQRARARQVAEIINSGVQPLQNSSTLRAIEALGHDKQQWARRWIQQGMDNLETLSVSFPQTRFVASDSPSIADFCLIPQLYNARRFGCTPEFWPRLLEVEARCLALAAFRDAHPDRQPDAQ